LNGVGRGEGHFGRKGDEYFPAVREKTKDPPRSRSHIDFGKKEKLRGGRRRR